MSTPAIHAALTKAIWALALAAADMPCLNGCGCEGYDYCAQDECRAALNGLTAIDVSSGKGVT